MPHASTEPERPRRRSLGLGGDFLRRLEHLAIAAERLQATGGTASRAGTVRGGRVEFLEHRGYVEGDDLRDLDWNVYARTDEPFVKVFGAEREKRVTLIVDLSPSMHAVPGKDVFAARLAAALLHVALAAGDTAQLALAGNGLIEFPAQRGAAASRGFIDRLERAEATPPVDWGSVAAQYALKPRPPGAVVVISDFYEDAVVQALLPLAKSRQEVTLLQVLTPDELAPRETGAIRFEDAETGEAVSLSVSPADLDAVRAWMDNHVQALADAARRHRMRHLLCPTDTPFERLVLTWLRRGGLLR